MTAAVVLPDYATDAGALERDARAAVVSLLRSSGYRGAGFVELTRAGFRELGELAYYRAEDECRGAMLSPAGRAVDADPRRLFYGRRGHPMLPEATAWKYASEEVRTHWEQVGRLTFDDYCDDLLRSARDEVRAAANYCDDEEDDVTVIDDAPTRLVSVPDAVTGDGQPVERGAAELLLDSCRAFVRRFWAPPSEAALDALVLWAAHTHAVDQADTLVFNTTPRLFLGSKGKASGKSTALHLLSLLSRSSELVSDPTGPSLVNLLATERPTILIDELDTLLGQGAGARTTRNVMLDGYKRLGHIVRGKQSTVQRVSAFAPMAFAGLWQNWISNPVLDPARSRTILIPCQRRPHGTRVEVFRERDHEWQAADLVDALARWGAQRAQDMGDCRPTLPHGVEDRVGELWEPLLAVGIVVGGKWRERAYAACKALAQGVPPEDTDEPRTPLDVLRRDLPIVFSGVDRMASRDLVQALADLPGSYWGRLPRDEAGRVEPVAAGKEVASILAPLGVIPGVVKLDGMAVRGYDWEQLEAHCGPRPEPGVDELDEVPW